MVISIGIDIKGIEEVTRMLQEVTGKALREAYWELYRACDDTVVPNVKNEIETMRFPTHIGLMKSRDLKDSIRATPVGDGRYRYRKVMVHDGVDYGIHHELGFHFSKEFAEHSAWGKGIPPAKWYGGDVLEGVRMQNPFLRPGAMKSVPVILNRLESVIEKNLRGVNK